MNPLRVKLKLCSSAKSGLEDTPVFTVPIHDIDFCVNILGYREAFVRNTAGMHGTPSQRRSGNHRTHVNPLCREFSSIHLSEAGFKGNEEHKIVAAIAKFYTFSWPNGASTLIDDPGCLEWNEDGRAEGD